MTKIRKVKRRKTYKVDINRKRLRNKLRKVPTITCPQIKEAWDPKKSTKSNLVQMGLAYDPNQVIKIPNVKSDLIKTAKRKLSGDLSDSEDDKKVKKKVPKKIQVAQELEAEAKAPRERKFRLPNGQVHFLTYLMETYGDDYEAMARDKKNYYQLTWKQIRQKINTFKNIPEQYAEYLLKNGEIVLDDPTPLEVTKKKIAEENVKKFCEPKKPKKKKRQVSQWLEESIDNEEEAFDNGDTLEDIEEDHENTKETDKSLKNDKKLKLFPDEDSEDDEIKVKTKAKPLKKSQEVRKSDKNGKKEKLLEKAASSDREDSEELEDDEEGADFRDLSDLSDEELSEDDILDDGEFVTDTDDSD